MIALLSARSPLRVLSGKGWSYSYYSVLAVKSASLRTTTFAFQLPSNLKAPGRGGKEAAKGRKGLVATEKLAKQTTSLKKEIDAIQAANPSHILLNQVGMFYEIYDCGGYLDDISAMLGLRIGIHQKANGSDHRYHRFAGFPTISLRNHLEVLLKNGLTVAIVDQQPPNPLNGVITRKVSRIITPGTLLDDSDLRSTDNNFLLSIFTDPSTKSKVALAWLDVSTGEFNLSISNVKKLMDDLTRIAPKEVITSEKLADENPAVHALLKEFEGLVTVKPANYFTSRDSLATLAEALIISDPGKAIFTSNPSDVLKTLKPLQPQAASGLLRYLEESFPNSRPSIRAPVEIYSSESMTLDAATIQSLEITHTQRENNKKGSLLSVIDKTKTAAGHRLLSSRLKAPSTILKEINRRLSLVNIFYKDPFLNINTTSLLNACKDIERSLQRIHFQAASPSDLANIIHTLKTSEEIKELLYTNIQLVNDPEEKQYLQELLDQMGDFKGITSSLLGLISEENLSSNKINSVGLIQGGCSEELDALRLVHHELLEKQEKRRNELSLFFNPRLGPIVEIGKITDKSTERVIASLEKRSELSHATNSKRGTAGSTKIKDEIWTKLYHEIQETIDQLLRIEGELFNGACEKIKGETLSIVSLCKSIAELDVSTSIATLSINLGYVKPSVVDVDAIHQVVAGRHPVVEYYQMGRGNDFMVNNSNLNKTDQILLLTGPNMGGKSTYLRQCAILSIMAQTGLFIPCASAKLGIVDQIFTRIGSSDDLSANQSTFMIEMKETAHILENATHKSLIIMDEVGRGTSTKDGLALALSILNHIGSVNQSLTVFATHYHELATMIPLNKTLARNISFYQAAAHFDQDEKLTCLYQIIPGVMDRSHGIQIAEYAGLPRSVIKEANDIYLTL